MTVITLTTDFGTADGYPGVMKGVILGIAPDVTLVDLTHEIPPQDIRAAAFVLQSACPYFPPGAIHVAVVDPGVGTGRRALAVRTARSLYVGPDNGVLSWALHGERVEAVVGLAEPAYWLPEVSGTFHGRDVFAPAAGHLARGLPLERMGVPVADPARLPLPRPSCEARGSIHTEVIYIDRFGNLVTGIRVQPRDLRVLNLPPEAGSPTLDRGATVQLLGRLCPVRHAYAEVGPGEPVALIGSSGYLEIAVRDGSAAASFGARIGDRVEITLSEATGR